MNVFDIYIVNELHYQLWERRGQEAWRRSQRTIRRWRERVTGWREARVAAKRECTARQRAEGKSRMEAKTLERAKARSVISELDEPFLAALQQELYERWYDQLVAKAREELEPEYDAKFQRWCEHWQDEHAGYKRMLQDEFDVQRERDREQDRRRLRQEFEERFETAQEAQAQAEFRLEQTDEQLIQLITSLLPAGKKPFLHDCGIETLDMWGLNRILQRHGLQMMHELTESKQRVVKIRTGEAEWQAATRFWLQPYEAPEEPRVNGIPTKYVVKL